MEELNKILSDVLDEVISNNIDGVNYPPDPEWLGVFVRHVNLGQVIQLNNLTFAQRYKVYSNYVNTDPEKDALLNEIIESLKF